MTDEGSFKLKFITDEMLGKLAKWLRILGYDTAYYSNGEDEGLVQRALAEDRIILTRDTHIIERKLARKIILIRSDQTWEQLRQLVDELVLDVESRLLTRCIMCNNKLIAIDKENVQDRVPAYTYLTQNEFYKCPGCERIYWPGTHKDSMLGIVNNIVA